VSADTEDPVRATCRDCRHSTRRVLGRGLCTVCYKRHRRDGSLEAYPRAIYGIERVRRWLATMETEQGCWPWPGSTSQGYGEIMDGGRRLLVHRVAYELLVGPIDAGLFIDHLCHNATHVCSDDVHCPHRACANPSHLEPVPSGVNTVRGHTITGRNARKTHCNGGHLLAGKNLYITPGTGFRQCRECKRATDRRLYWRAREEAS